MDVSELDKQLEKKDLFGYWKVKASAQPPEPPLHLEVERCSRGANERQRHYRF